MSQVHLKITKGVTGVYVGQIEEIPAIIVQAESPDKLVTEASKSLDLYFEAFPKEQDKIFRKERRVEYKAKPS